MDIFRTPDSAFAEIRDFPYKPNYLLWDGLRTHYIDEGPRDGPIALLLHGEPTWSYLYRKMIPTLIQAGYRCIAPDHIGFGRSDKVIRDEWYVIDKHIDRLRDFITLLDLSDITLIMQDWGGPIGLINAVEAPKRVDRLVILNTWLHHSAVVYSPAIRAWREAAINPHWLGWTKHNLPCGAIVRRALIRPMKHPHQLEDAYEAPFTGSIASKAGARRFPWCIPFAEPEAGAAIRQEKAFIELQSWTKPVHFIFGSCDPIFPPSTGKTWAAKIPSATFETIENAGHFCQEDAGPEIVQRLVQLVKGT
ncbi:MAG: hypothetical protein CMM58_03810 [Rhodospirillaceae bacterium]|nr:hypothetical protein [Rhodospirillaceae bacterium]|tara:strand:- start:604 stop:1521 length:918 start_codon:yes stop_codon:yes gene_type:complete